MKRFNLIFAAGFICLLSITTMQAQNDKLPPIIDRDIFFGNPEISGAQISPDGQYMTFIKPYNEVRNIWIKKTNEPFDAARPITADTKRPIPGYFWTDDSKYVLFVQDKGGDENFHVYAVDPAAKAAEGEEVPESRNLTNVDGVRAFIYRVSKIDPNTMYVGLNDRDASYHDLYKVNIATGERTLIRENTDKISGWDFDHKDQIRLAARTKDDNSTEILRVEDDKFVPIYECGPLETCYTTRFHKDNEKIYLVTNAGDDVDLTQLMLLDVATGKTTFVESDPDKEVDFGGANFSDVTKEMIVTVYVGDKPRLYFKDKNFEADYNWLKKELKGSEINLGSSTKDENLWIISATSDVDPGATYLYDRKNKKLTFQYRPRPKLPVEDLAHMTVVRYKSSDGLEIPAYLTLPKGVEAKNLPVVIMPHGGPWARDYWGYNSYHQFLANRGYAVLSPNFRSSTGFGKKFLNAGNGEWGDLMQDDITAGAEYLIKEGIANKDKIGIMGGSYGGYATLAGMTFTPDVYAAGVSIVGPSNLITLLESLPPYWEAGRKMFYLRMGDPTTEEGKKQLMRQSPLNSANKIKKPLMVVQGANDPRVKKAESDQIIIAMRELGLPVTYICADDEGHGFRRPENNMAFLAETEKFLAEHLGGRYQESMPEDVAARLKEITVDINTVELAAAYSKDDMMAGLPTPKDQIKAGTSKYQTTIAMGGQEMKMDVDQTITEADGNWTITQSATSPMGNMSDKITLKKGSLAPVMREIAQGPATIKIAHADSKVSGSMNMGGNEKPIAADLEAPVFGDGVGLEVTLTQLPLSKDYETVVRTFDIQAQKTRPWQVKVLGMETVEVGAGKFEAYKVELNPMDGNTDVKTFWISSKGDAQVVKSTATMPSMGGAKVTSELMGK